MIKHYCDKCEAEITDRNKCVGGHLSNGRLGTEIEFRTEGMSPFTKRHSLRIELMHTYDGTSNDGIFCKYCILDAFARLDDRSKGSIKHKITQ